MVDMNAAVDSAWSKVLIRFVFVPAITVLCAVSAYFLSNLVTKIDGAVDKASVAESNKALWTAIRDTTKAQSELANNMTLLRAQSQSHEKADEVQQQMIHDTLSDIKSSLKTLSTK